MFILYQYFYQNKQENLHFERLHVAVSLLTNLKCLVLHVGTYTNVYTLLNV